MSSPSALFGFVCLFVVALAFVYLNKTNQPVEATNAPTAIVGNTAPRAKAPRAPAPAAKPAKPPPTSARPSPAPPAPRPDSPAATPPLPSAGPPTPASGPSPAEAQTQPRFGAGAQVTGLRFEPLSGGPAQGIEDLTKAGRAVILNFDAAGDGRYDGSARLLQGFRERYGDKVQVYLVRREPAGADSSLGGRLRGLLGRNAAPLFPVLAWSDELAQSFGIDEARGPTRVLIDHQGVVAATIAAPTAEEVAAGAKIDSLPTLAMRHLFGAK